MGKDGQRTGRGTLRGNMKIAKIPAEITKPKEAAPGWFILEYQHGLRSTYIRWRNQGKCYMLSKYGNPGLFMESLQLWRPAAVADPAQLDAFSETNDPFGTKRAEHHLKLKDYHAILTDCQKKEPQMFGDILNHISLTVEDKAKTHADWQTKANMPKDLAQLMVIIDFLMTTVAGIDVYERKNRARREWNNLHQVEGESLIHFKERFEAALRALAAAGCEEKDMKEEEKAYSFLIKVNSKYYENPQQVLTNIRKIGGAGFPDSVQKAEEILTQWKYPVRERVSMSHETTFATDMKPRRGDAANESARDTDEKPRRKFNGNCNHCGKFGHMAKDCWSKDKRGDQVQSESKRHATKPKSRIEEVKYTEAEESEEFDCSFVRDDDCEIYLSGIEEIDTFVTNTARVESAPDDDYIVFIDNCSTGGVIRNRNMLSNIRKGKVVRIYPINNKGSAVMNGNL